MQRGLVPRQPAVLVQLRRHQGIAHAKYFPQDSHPLKGVFGIGAHGQQACEPSVNRMIATAALARLQRHLQARALKGFARRRQPFVARRQHRHVAPLPRAHRSRPVLHQPFRDLPRLLRQPRLHARRIHHRLRQRNPPHQPGFVRRARLERHIGHLEKGRRRTHLHRQAEIYGVFSAKDRRQRRIEQANDRMRRAKRHQKLQQLPAVAPPKGLHVPRKIPDVRAAAVNRLLPVADHAKMSRPRPLAPPRLLRPGPAHRSRSPRQLDQHRELLRVGVLRLIQDDVPAFGPHPVQQLIVAQHRHRRVDLIHVGLDATRESPGTITRRQFRREDCRRVRQPALERRHPSLRRLHHHACRTRRLVDREIAHAARPRRLPRQCALLAQRDVFRA